jgi:hypothetical protein
MSNSDVLYLPVSIGEAIDKLSILDIKYEKITDYSRKMDVKNEYDLLYDILKEHIIKYENLYKMMKTVNRLIWDMMDSLRDGELNENDYLKICKDCIEYNDIRFRVKNKINYISNSFLKEQKSYKIIRLVIIIENEMNYELLLHIIKYCSFIYDEIVIQSSLNLIYLKDYFAYDTTILFKIDETIDYVNKIVIENLTYTTEQLHNLFHINEIKLNKIMQ